MKTKECLSLLGAVVTAALVSAVVACGDSGGATTAGTNDSTSAGPTTAGSGSSGTMSGTNPSGTMSGTEGSTSGVTDCPIFEDDIVPIFESSCGAGVMSCHARDAYGADASQECRGWLALENEALGSLFYSGPDEGNPTGCPDMPLFDRLTQLDAWQCEAFDPRVRYVIPCDAEASYLVRKIDGGPYCQNTMGEVTQPMPPGVQMDPGDIATIKDWINAGAPTLTNPKCGCADDPTSDTNGMVGNAPEVQINHPGQGEERPVNSLIPFIGVAQDVEDGELTGAALAWESDLEGTLGQGNSFDLALTMTGQHTITLSATDSDDNTSVDQIQITVIP